MSLARKQASSCFLKSGREREEMNSGVSGYSLENLGAELMCIDANATVCFGEDATVKKCKTTSKLTFLNETKL